MNKQKEKVCFQYYQDLVRATTVAVEGLGQLFLLGASRENVDELVMNLYQHYKMTGRFGSKSLKF